MKIAGGVITGLALLLGLFFIFVMGDPIAPVPIEAGASLRSVLWEARSLDLIGQMLIILGGTFGVLVLTKDRMEA